MTDQNPSVRHILADVLGVDIESLGPQSAMHETDGWDSFSHIQAIAALEEEFGVTFAPWRIPQMDTVAKIEAELASLRGR